MGRLVCTNPNETRDHEFVQKDKDGNEIGKVTFTIGSLPVRVIDRIIKLTEDGRLMEASELSVRHSVKGHKGDLYLDDKPLPFTSQKDEWTGKQVVSDWLMEVYLATGFLSLVGNLVLDKTGATRIRQDIVSIKPLVNVPESELEPEKIVEKEQISS